jgi:polyphosphate kinase 2 (PPK2 family)
MISWRIHQNVRARGMMMIFNRSRYEDVLSPVVHGVIIRKEARQRFDEINDFEKMLSHNTLEF